jgi:hypothetical protein
MLEGRRRRPKKRRRRPERRWRRPKRRWRRPKGRRPWWWPDGLIRAKALRMYELGGSSPPRVT